MPMASPPDTDHWLARPPTIRALWIGASALLATLVLLDLAVPHHPHFGIDGWFGFGAWYGLLSCVALVLLAKALRLLLERPETHDDRD